MQNFRPSYGPFLTKLWTKVLDKTVDKRFNQTLMANFTYALLASLQFSKIRNPLEDKKNSWVCWISQKTLKKNFSQYANHPI